MRSWPRKLSVMAGERYHANSSAKGAAFFQQPFRLMSRTRHPTRIIDSQASGDLDELAVLVALAKGEPLGVVDVERSLAYAPLFLHRDLLAGQTGQIMSGIMAIGALFLLGRAHVDAAARMAARAQCASA